MQIEQALMTYLLAQSGITDLVGTGIHFAQAPQDISKPYIVVFKVDGPREHSHEGGDGLAHPRFQLSIFGTTYTSVKAVAAAVKTALQGYSGTMGGESGVVVGACFYADETDLYEEANKLFHIAVDYIIWHKET